MELSTPAQDATVCLDDLRALAELGLMRLSGPEEEARRAARMRLVVAAASDLSHTLVSHTRCMLVNCQGSRGVGNLAYETDQLHAALSRYADLVHDVVREGPRIVEAASADDTKRHRSQEVPAPRAGIKPTLRRAV
jgi:hypothetical protein